ncbi:MAG: heavy metal sensor histidine kinase [Gemmatimonadota bacterium]|nr:heavy metal sensor histidine kinase [Gemmatimonadota bacterium]
MTGHPPGRRPWSMTRRLTAWYAATAFGLLALAAAVVYVGLAHTLHTEDARFILAKGEELQTIARRFPGRLDMLRDEITFESAMPALQSYSARILGPAATPVAETRGMAGVLPAGAFPPVGAPSLERRAADGHTYLLFAQALSDGQARAAQIAVDVTRDDDVLDVQLVLLGLVVLVGTVVAGAAGYAIARRGLAPIERISEMATSVSADRLDRRLGVTSWPAELGQLAAAFDHMLNRLQESFGRLSRFSADLAHELRTPLTNLRSTAEVALRGARTPDEYRDALESALEEYERLAGMVDRLLFLARAEAGAAALDLQPLDLAEEIAATCEYCAPLAGEAGVALESVGGAPVQADRGLVRRALTNVVTNAVAHTPAGGRVTIVAGLEGTRAIVRVRDTGTGIPADALAHVFERFYRVDEGTGDRRPGSGLGLALVRSIMELHGGSAEITSAPGAGTTVTLTLPVDGRANITPP